MNASTTVFMSRGPVAFFTINRPEAGNAMTWAMYDALVDACERVDAAPELRAFVIRATGAVFCTGHRHQPVRGVLDARATVSHTSAVSSRRWRGSSAWPFRRSPRWKGSRPAPAARSRSPATCASARRRPASACRSPAPWATGCRSRTARGSSSTSGSAGPGRCSSPGDSSMPPRRRQAASCTRLAEPADVERVVDELAAAIARNAPLTIRAAKKALGRLTCSEPAGCRRHCRSRRGLLCQR